MIDSKKNRVNGLGLLFLGVASGTDDDALLDAGVGFGPEFSSVVAGTECRSQTQVEFLEFERMAVGTGIEEFPVGGAETEVNIAACAGECN